MKSVQVCQDIGHWRTLMNTVIGFKFQERRWNSGPSELLPESQQENCLLEFVINSLLLWRYLHFGAACQSKLWNL